MPFLQTKIYRTRKKSKSIFFSPEFKKKLILVLSANEMQQPEYIENLNKTTKALGLDPTEDIHFHATEKNEVFDWAGLLNHSEPLIIAFFGKGISGLEFTNFNMINHLGIHTIFETYSMSDIVSDTAKKGQFWLSFKSLFSK